MQEVNPISLTIIIPALNEQENIKDAVEEALRAASSRVREFEILLINDGSTDRTGEIMDEISRKDPRIKVLHNKAPNNLGGAYKQGVNLAAYDYLMMIPGDNEVPSSATIPIIESIGKADMIIPYTTNMYDRPLGRRIGSKGYTMLLNLFFNKKIKYYNGTTVLKSKDVKSLSIKTNSFAYMSEILLKLLNSGKSYYEIGIRIRSPHRASTALRLGNILGVLKAIRNLHAEINRK